MLLIVLCSSVVFILTLLVNLLCLYSIEVLANCRIYHENWCDIDNRENPVSINEGDSIKITIDNAKAITTFSITQVEETPDMIRAFPFGIFQNFVRLQKLFVRGIRRMMLLFQYFTGGERLVHLSLEDNGIRTITSKVFRSLPNVTSLLLGYNKIESIEDYAFWGMNNLRLIELGSNRIYLISRLAFAGARSIESLNLIYNEIKTIEDGSLDLPNLRDINLQSNKLFSLSDKLLINAPNVVNAHFGSNYIINIGKAFDNCHKLEHLYLYGNPILDVNLLSLASLENLKLLDLQATLFKFSSEKPAHIPTKSKLNKIILSMNDLSNADILTHLSVFGQLEEIVSYYNNFTTLNDVSEVRNYFPRLRKINLSRNGGSICKWIKENEHFLAGISVWSTDLGGSNECSSKDYRREVEPRE